MSISLEDFRQMLEQKCQHTDYNNNPDDYNFYSAFELLVSEVIRLQREVEILKRSRR